MTSAKITRCKHYFHGVCLRKWLYVQDKCPLCHEVVISQDKQAVPEPVSPVEPINLNLNVDEHRQTPNASIAAPAEPDVELVENLWHFDVANLRNNRASDDSDSNGSNYTSNSDETPINFNIRNSPSRHFGDNFN